MKTLLIILLLLSSIPLYSQSINNTLGTGGSFNILDGTTTFLSLSQSNGSLRLSNISIFKGTDSFIHDYQAPGTAGWNTFIGLNAGNFTMSGSTASEASFNTAVGFYSLSSLTNGYYNSGFGYNSLYSNTSGFYNSAFGSSSLSSNTTGNQNSAFGAFSLFNNTEGDSNSAVGSRSLYLNTTGSFNSAFGNGSLENNTEGYWNSAFGNTSLYSNVSGTDNSSFGHRTLYSNTTGVYNSAFGNFSLYSNTIGRHNSAFGGAALQYNVSGTDNSAFGVNALRYNTTGTYNTAVGLSAGLDITTGSNNIAIGYLAQVPSPTASNQVRIGNDNINYAGIQVAWTITSDKRWKQDIQPSNLGLDFISKLHPVSYSRINDESGKTEYGFIAQEVENALKDFGVNAPGIITVDNKGYYQLRYNDLLAPVVKAIQELKNENEMLKNEVTVLRDSIVSIVQNEVKKAQLKPVQLDEKSLKITLNSEMNKVSD